PMNLHDVRIPEAGHGALNGCRAEHVIGVQNHDHLSAAQPAHCVVGRPSAFVPFPEDWFYPICISSDDLARVVAGSIVHDDHLGFGISLIQGAVDAVLEKAPVVVTADDDARERPVVHAESPCSSGTLPEKLASVPLEDSSHRLRSRPVIPRTARRTTAEAAPDSRTMRNTSRAADIPRIAETSAAPADSDHTERIATSRAKGWSRWRRAVNEVSPNFFTRDRVELVNVARDALATA